MIYKPGPEYPDNWNRRRFAIFKSHGYICQNCGEYSKGDLHLHHKIPVKLGGSHSQNNLMVLCSFCHYNIHKNKSRY